MVEYAVVAATSYAELEASINALAREGFKVIKYQFSCDEDLKAEMELSVIMEKVEDGQEGS